MYQGTLPFMSAEILLNKPIFLKPVDFDADFNVEVEQSESAVIQDAVHDLEAFFWIVVWFVITRLGPALSRKQQLSDPKHPLHAIMVDLFESDNRSLLAKTKTLMFSSNTQFHHVILANVSLWCHPLRGLVQKFYRILEAAYKGREFDGLHGRVLELFDAWSIQLQNHKDIDENVALGEEEEKRRNGHGRGSWDSPVQPRITTADAYSDADDASPTHRRQKKKHRALSPSPTPQSRNRTISTRSQSQNASTSRRK